MPSQDISLSVYDISRRRLCPHHLADEFRIVVVGDETYLLAFRAVGNGEVALECHITDFAFKKITQGKEDALQRVL